MSRIDLASDGTTLVLCLDVPSDVTGPAEFHTAVRTLVRFLTQMNGIDMLLEVKLS